MALSRTLIQEAVTQDLLGPDVLLEPHEPATPSGYELVRLLGRGGCGEVYLARDLRLDRPVAIKFLTNASAADVERFRREARFTARLANPGIVQVYELGETAERPYIAMQYIDGRNLADADLDTAGVVGALRSVAEALRHTHAEGIVHRDIKPENILIDKAGHAYLTDFGIARSLDGRLGRTISQDGQIIGTPAIMSPEQARGDVQAVDARSDVYALGATMYTKLTGRHPFDGEHVIDVLHAVIHDPPPLPRSLNGSIPRRMESFILRCMEKCRDDRFQSMDEVIAGLDGTLGSDEWGGVSPTWFRRLVVGLHDVAEPLPRDDARADPYFTAGLEIVREISAWDADLYRVSGSLKRSFTRLDSIRRRLDEIVAARPDIAWARFYRGVVHARRGSLARAREDMERSIGGVDNLASAHFELGRLYLQLYLKEHRVAHKHITAIGIDHGLQSARSRLEQAVLAFGEARRRGGEVPTWLEACTGAVERLAASDYAGCIEACDRIVAEEPDAEVVWKLRGDAQRLAGAAADAVGSYRRAIEVRRSYFEALYAKAEAHLERGELVEAREDLEHAAEIHPEFADAVALLAQTYLIEARRNDDPAPLRRALEVAERAMRLDDRNYDAAVTLAEIKLELGRRSERNEWLHSAIEVLKVACVLDGCGNRVALLAAKARLELARRERAAGGVPREQLESILSQCRESRALVSDPMHWAALADEVNRELAAMG